MPPLEPPYVDPFARTDANLTPVTDPHAKAIPSPAQAVSVDLPPPAALTPEGTTTAQFLAFDAGDFDVQQQGPSLKIASLASSGTVAAGQGNLPLPMGDANQNLTAAQAAKGAVTTSGALTAARDLVYPTPAGDDYSFMRLIRNDCAGNNVVVKVAAGGNSVAVAPGDRLLVFIEPTGVTAAVTAIPV